LITIEQIKCQIEAAIPGAKLAMVRNDAPSAQHSLLVDNEHAVAVAKFLRDDPQLRLDFASNATGVDWPAAVVRTGVRKKVMVNGVETEVEEMVDMPRPGYLEAVYHLYSIELRHGPVILRLRTQDRSDRNRLPSLTPVWRSAELQEREIYDLYGIAFDGHPDLRRILMWEEFKDFPMRRDYVEPDDYEYEPTPHDAVLKRAKAHSSAEAKS
jgi:NADH-quinone oxidoreductase subunit C